MAETRKPFRRTKPFKVLASIVVAAVLSGVAWAGMAAGVFEGFRQQTTDLLFPAGHRDERIVVVGVDADTIDALGEPWPWSWSTHARLIDALREAGVAAVGYDVVFSPAREGVDDLAAAVARHGSVVLGVGVTGDLSRGAVPRPERLIEPVEQLLDAAAGTGHVAFTSADEREDVVRRLPLVLVDPDRGVDRAALSLATVALVADYDLSTPVTVRPSGVDVRRDDGTPRIIPTSADERFIVNYAPGLEAPASAAEAGAYISAIDLLAGDPSSLRTRLEGRVAFVGVTDPLLGDNVNTPVAKGGNGAPGVFVHANAANTLLTERFRYPSSDTQRLVAVAALALLACLLTLLLPLWSAPLAAIVLAGGYGWLADAQFEAGRTWGLVYPLLAIVLGAIAGGAIRYVTESRERRVVASLFSQYVPEQVAQQLIDAGRVQAATEGERIVVTAFFCDLRGFTALAAQLEPGQVRLMLRAYYEMGTRIVLEHGGTLMQYVGDEIYALFGAPMPNDHHADDAVLAAIAFQEAAASIAEHNAGHGLPALSYGIGINTGEVVAAHIGSSVRKQYSAIGDAINVGSRLCAIAPPGEINVSLYTKERLTVDVPLEWRGPVTLKGVAPDFEVYRVWNPDLPPLEESEAPAPKYVDPKAPSKA